MRSPFRLPLVALVSDIADEYGRFVKQQGLLAGMVAPDMNGLAIVFTSGEPTFQN